MLYVSTFQSTTKEPQLVVSEKLRLSWGDFFRNWKQSFNIFDFNPDIQKITQEIDQYLNLIDEAIQFPLLYGNSFSKYAISFENCTNQMSRNLHEFFHVEH